MPKAGSSRPSDRTFYRGALLGEQDRVAKRDRNDVDAELDPAGAAGERGHDAHAFEDRLMTDDAVGLPQRVDAALFAQIDPPPEPAGPAEWKLHQAEPDGDSPRHSLPREGCAAAAAGEKAAPMSRHGRPRDDAMPAPPGATPARRIGAAA